MSLECSLDRIPGIKSHRILRSVNVRHRQDTDNNNTDKSLNGTEGTKETHDLRLLTRLTRSYKGDKQPQKDDN